MFLRISYLDFSWQSRPDKRRKAALTADSVFSDRPISQTKTGTDNPTYEGDEVKRTTKPPHQGLESETLLPQKLPHKIYLGIMFVMVIIATIVISANGEAGLVVFFH